MTFEDLDSWKRSRELVRMIYQLNRDAELSRDFGLRDQIQRASVSVMANIAEGFERTGSAEKMHFYNIARASNGEVRSLLYVVLDNYPHLGTSITLLMNHSIETGRLLSGLISSTRRRSDTK